MTSRALVGGMGFAIGTALGICCAVAAGLPPAPSPAPPAPVAYAPPQPDMWTQLDMWTQPDMWTGFYFGGHVGGGYAGSSWSDPITGMGNDTFNSGVGFLGGAQIGGNVQFNWLVLGVEGDFSWTSLKGSGTDSIGDTINTNTQWTSTVTGRVGVAFYRLLVYGKGGLALAEDLSSLTDLGGNTATTNLLRTGWTAGGGLEYALDRNWSAKIEYDYLGFGSRPLNFTTPLLGTVTSNASLNVQEIKAGVNFRFGGP